MQLPKTIARLMRRGTLVGAASLGAVALVPAVSHAAIVSSNWAGYVAVRSAASAKGFSSVSGSWIQPRATCSAGEETYSAVWVGLGGAHEGATSLEQVGTDSNCARSGQPVYQSWFELLPAAPVNLNLTVAPGDRMAASVTVRNRKVTLRIRDLTSGARFGVTRELAKLDVSSADWIVEAPSTCEGGSCRTLTLTNFGDVSFTSASASALGHTGAITDHRWFASRLELRQGQGQGQGQGGSVGEHLRESANATSGLVSATASTSASVTGAFAVSWAEVPPVSGQSPAAPTFAPEAGP